MLADGDHGAAIGDPGRNVVGERGQAGQRVGQSLNQASVLVGTPPENLHFGEVRLVQSAVQGLPVGGRRGESVGQFTPRLAVGTLLLVARFLLLSFARETRRTVQHHDCVSGM